jgi:cobalt-zinc-cadmium resistance protein CzcA
VEFFVPLKPFNEWPWGLTKQKLIAQMSERLNHEIIGVDFNFSQYIQDNIEEAVSGVKGENSVKIFGRDLNELERLSQSVKAEIARVPGVKDPAAFNLIGQPNLVIRIDRAKAARYGISVLCAPFTGRERRFRFWHELGIVDLQQANYDWLQLG